MDERPYLPNYDPKFCQKVGKWAAASCVVWLTIALLTLILVDPSNSRCPGWIIYAGNGEGMSPWLFVGMFTALPTYLDLLRRSAMGEIFSEGLRCRSR